MRNATPEMIAFLQQRLQFFVADLFTVTLRDGTTFRWTTADSAIYHGGNTWLSTGPLLQRTSWSMSNTVEVQEMVVEVASGSDDFVDGTNLKLAVHNGLLDGASVFLQRAIMPTFGDTSLGLIDLFLGKVGKVTITAIGFQMTVRGDNVLLSMFMPRNRYQLNCIHTLYDSGCTLLKADFSFTIAVATATKSRVNWVGGGTFDPARFAAGMVYFEGGPAYGSRRSIQSADSSGVDLAYPLYATPEPGDMMTLSYGCLKTQGACEQFANKQHFRGFPFLPQAETAY